MLSSGKVTRLITFLVFNICTVYFSACIKQQLPPLPTGLTKAPVAGGIKLEATGRASENAIRKQSRAMMQATSCEAARLLIQYELKQGEYPRANRYYADQETYILRNGEYCRIIGLYRK